MSGISATGPVGILKYNGTIYLHRAGTDIGHRAGTDIGHCAGTDIGHRAGTDIGHRAGTNIGIQERVHRGGGSGSNTNNSFLQSCHPGYQDRKKSRGGFPFCWTKSLIKIPLIPKT